jgi:hypothetical protein
MVLITAAVVTVATEEIAKDAAVTSIARTHEETSGTKRAENSVQVDLSIRGDLNVVALRSSNVCHNKKPLHFEALLPLDAKVKQI